MVARRAHNPKVVGSNPTPATVRARGPTLSALSFCRTLPRTVPPPSSRGLGRRPFKAEIRGSNPLGGTMATSVNVHRNLPRAETSARRRPQLTTVLTTVRSSFLTTVHRSTLTNRWRATKTRCASLPTPRMGEGAHGSHRSLDAGVEPPSPPSALLTIPVLGIDGTHALEGPSPVALVDLSGLEPQPPSMPRTRSGVGLFLGNNILDSSTR